MSNNNEWFPPSCALFDECFLKCSQHLIFQVNVQPAFPLILPKSLLWCPQKQTAQNSERGCVFIQPFSVMLTRAAFSLCSWAFLQWHWKVQWIGWWTHYHKLFNRFSISAFNFLSCISHVFAYNARHFPGSSPFVFVCLVSPVHGLPKYIYIFFFSGFMVFLVSPLVHY